MKFRIGWALAIAIVLISSLIGTPVGSVQAQTVSSVTVAHLSVSAQAQITQSAQINIHAKCAKYAPRAVICADKETDLTYALYKGKVVRASLKYDKRSRFGGWIVNAKGIREDHRTPNGPFPIIKFKSDAVSIKYGVAMPNYIKFTNDGVGIHYSEDFDLRGRRISHGCVGLKSLPYSAWLFDWAKRYKPLIVVAKG